jgi:hypothetical protein
MTQKEKYLKEILSDIIKMKDKEIADCQSRLALKGTGFTFWKDHPRIGYVLFVMPELRKDF